MNRLLSVLACRHDSGTRHASGIASAAATAKAGAGRSAGGRCPRTAVVVSACLRQPSDSSNAVAALEGQAWLV